ncbi:MAG TPA: HlyD family secretion protein [Puia sp.]|nr:HlyD family secretion protein [Puia sp.]
METNIVTKPEKKKSNHIKKIVQSLLGVMIGVGILYYAGINIFHAMKYESTDNAQIESSATPVISRVSGYIGDFNLVDYQSVKGNQLLLTIDDREYRLALQKTEADLSTAKSDLSSAEADLAAAEAQLGNVGSRKDVALAGVRVEQVNLEKANLDLKRDQALYNDGSITKRQLDNTTAIFLGAQQQMNSSKTKVVEAGTQFGSAKAQIQRANAQIERAKSNIALKQFAVENANLNLSYTRIIAPTEGKIGKTNLQKGQFVQAGQVLFTIVNNEKYWIIANFKETQIGQMRVGQNVEIEISGYPDVKIQGKIADFSDATGARFSLLPPDNATGNFVKVTQRVPVKIVFENENKIKEMLKAGLSVVVDVRIK